MSILSTDDRLNMSEIVDLGSNHNYRTEIPNIVFHLKLDPWAFKAYCVIKMTAGDSGTCFKSNSTMSEQIGCSIPTLIKLKNQLVEEGLIVITKRKHSSGGDMPDLIQIVDIWPQNAEYMLKIHPKNPKNDLWPWRQEGVKRGLGGGVNEVNGGGKRGLHKQDHKEQDHKKKQQQSNKPSPMTIRAAPVVASSNKIKIYDCLKDLPLNDVEKTNICRNHAEEKVLAAVKNALSRKTPARSLGALIFWLSSQSAEEKPSQEEMAAKNHQHAKEIEKHIIKNKNNHMEVLSKEVEFTFPTAQKTPIGLPYTDPMFKKKLQEYLLKLNIEVKNPLKSNT